jgi:hypothetical protein
MKALLALALLFAADCKAIPLDHLKGLSLLAHLKQNTAFENTWSRSPSPDAILKKFHLDFPFANLADIPNDCRALTKDNRSLLGDSDPVSGSPAIDNPNSAFVSWYQGCLTQYIRMEDRGLVEKRTISFTGGGASQETISPRLVSDFQDFFTPQVIEECRKKDDKDKAIGKPGDTMNLYSFRCRWKILSPAAKAALVEKIMEQYIGPPEVRQDLGVPGDFAAMVLKELDGYSAARDSRYDFLLPYPQARGDIRNATAILKFLIHFTGIGLKY